MPDIEDRFIINDDGLRLHLRVYGTEGSAVPVLCLPGLTRNLLDFDAIARRLAAPPCNRRVISLSSRGRGLSDRDPDPSRYTIPVEAADVLTVMDALKIKEAAFIGTSRGGLILHVLALSAAERIERAILNDIGPVLELEGLKEIQAALKARAPQDTLAEAAAALQAAYRGEFPSLSGQDWADMAQALYRAENGRLMADYDPAIGDQFRDLDLSAPLPALWQAYDALAVRPLMVIRGENSKLLSRQTVEEMARRQPQLAVIEAKGQGHAPLLHLRDLPEQIAAFLER